MNLRKTAMLFTLGAAALATPLAANLALAARFDHPDFTVEVKQMANKDDMVTKQEFLKLMSKKFDAMDHAKKGMLTTTQIMQIFNDNTGS